MSVDEVRVTPDWLALREPADAAARAVELVDRLREHLPGGNPLAVHDLGCGTGAMSRWLAPLLPGPQHWVLYDRDAALLDAAAAHLPATAADGTAVTVETRLRDITRLEPADLADAGLVTASALLDMLSVDELDRFVAACVGAGCPTLMTLSVVGQVELAPPDPLDDRVAGAFDAHQRRTTGRRRLLGPDAFGTAVDALTRLGAQVHVADSPWRLGADHAALAAEWFTGWLRAAGEQDPDLLVATAGYAPLRLAESAAGRLRVTVAHRDLLALPGGGPR